MPEPAPGLDPGDPAAPVPAYAPPSDLVSGEVYVAPSSPARGHHHHHGPKRDRADQKPAEVEP